MFYSSGLLVLNISSKLYQLRLSDGLLDIIQWQMNQFHFLFLVKVLSIIIYPILVDVDHPLAADLKQLLGTVETREMSHISRKSLRNAPLRSLQDSIDLCMQGPNAVTINNQTLMINTVFRS